METTIEWTSRVVIRRPNLEVLAADVGVDVAVEQRPAAEPSGNSGGRQHEPPKAHSDDEALISISRTPGSKLHVAGDAARAGAAGARGSGGP